MTKLTPENSPVIRETAVMDRCDPLIVELHPRYLTVRLKGHRNGAVNVSYDAIRDLGLKIAARGKAFQIR